MLVHLFSHFSFGLKAVAQVLALAGVSFWSSKINWFTAFIAYWALYCFMCYSRQNRSHFGSADFFQILLESLIVGYSSSTGDKQEWSRVHLLSHSWESLALEEGAMATSRLFKYANSYNSMKWQNCCWSCVGRGACWGSRVPQVPFWHLYGGGWHRSGFSDLSLTPLTLVIFGCKCEDFTSLAILEAKQ